MQNIIDEVFTLAGGQRNKTFAAAAAFILKLPEGSVLIETGCYRGMACDGQSTLILALLAKQIRGTFFSFDLSEKHIASARALLAERGLEQHATFWHGNSAMTLQATDIMKEVSFAYLDSYDFELNAPLRAQSHQLVELGLLLPRMTPRSAFLLDDADLPDGGKVRLSFAALLAAGYTVAESGYQRFLVRG